MKKWWFRLLIVIFLAVFIFGIPTIWLSEVNKVYDGCLQYYGSAILDHPEAYSLCNSNAKKAWTYPGIISSALIMPILIFYLIQFIFFKIIINFVILGGKK